MLRSWLNAVSQHLNKDSQVVNRDFEDGARDSVPWWDQNDQNVRNPMDDLQPGAQDEQEPAGSRTVVRRTEITVEREITTVILRRKDQSSGPAVAPKPSADQDSDDNI